MLVLGCTSNNSIQTLFVEPFCACVNEIISNFERYDMTFDIKNYLETHKTDLFETALLREPFRTL